MKIVGKFLLWVLAYAIGAALIVTLFVRRPAPPSTAPEPAAQAGAPESPPASSEAPTSGDAPTTSDAVPAPAPAATGQEPSLPRRVKALRIPAH